MARVATVVRLAARYEALAAELATLNARFAEMVRDGAEDARPSTSAIEAMSAIGRLHHEAQVASALGQSQLDATNAYLEDALRSAPIWAHRQAGISRSAVRELTAVNRCLERYPLIAEAFIRGRLRTGELVQIDRIVPRTFFGSAKSAAIEFLRSVQAELLAAAEASLTIDEFTSFCRAVRDRLDTDGVPPKTRGAHESELTFRQLYDGRWEFHGLFSADDGAILRTQLEERDQKNLRARKDDPELKGTRDDRCREVRHASALLELTMAGAGASRPGRVGLFLHMGLEDLVALGAESPTPKARTEANYDVSDETLWALLAGAEVTPIITEAGTPLSYGRTRRLAPEILRRALAFRDRTCWFPACDGPPHAHDLHHLWWWIHGGTTDPVNNKGGCSFHHHCVHDRGWKVIAPPGGAPGDAILIKPDGTVYDPTPRWRQHRRDARGRDEGGCDQ